MNTPAGGAKLVETMTKKHGSYEAWVEVMRQRGSKGGKVPGKKGFANDDRNLLQRVMRKPSRAARTGALGGAASRRGKNNENAL